MKNKEGWGGRTKGCSGHGEERSNRFRALNTRYLVHGLATNCLGPKNRRLLRLLGALAPAWCMPSGFCDQCSAALMVRFVVEGIHASL